MQPPNFTLENNFKRPERPLHSLLRTETGQLPPSLLYDVALVYSYRECFQRPTASPVTMTILNVTAKLTAHTKVYCK